MQMNDLLTIQPEQYDRQRFIGSSDIAGILGISPWKTPLDVFLDKTVGREEITDPNKLKVLRRGSRMEPYIVDLLSEEQGLTIVKRGERYIDAELPYVAAEIDAETDDGRNVEIKTVSPFKAADWGELGTDEIPVYYTAQAMHALMVTNREVCIFGVLIGGDDFRVYEVKRDDETIAAIRAKEIEFWQRIEDNNPPEPSNVADIMRLFKQDDGNSVEASGQILQDVLRLKELKAQVKDIDKDINKLEEAIKLAIGGHTTLTIGGKPLATWKYQTATRFDLTVFKEKHPDMYEAFTKTSSSRVLRLK